MILMDGPGFLTALTTRFGDAVLLRWGRHRFYVFNHPDLIEELLIGKGRHFSKPPVVPQLRSIFGQGLLTSDGELHRRQRRLMQPAFLRSRIDSYGETIARCAAGRRDSWRDGQQLYANEFSTVSRRKLYRRGQQ